MAQWCPIIKDKCRYFGCGEGVCVFWNMDAKQCQVYLGLEALIKGYLELSAVISELKAAGRLAF